MSENKLAIVTGGGSGIGEAFCKKLASMGYDVAVCDINLEGAKKVSEFLKEEYKIQSEAIYVDVADYEKCTEMVKNVIDTMGDRLAVLVNNAAIGSGGPFLDAKPEEFMKVLNIDLCSMMNVTQNALPYMIKHNFGRIINMSSASAIDGIPMGSIYCAAKAGVIGLTKAWAKEFASNGITVNAIAPGVTDTPMLPNRDPEMLRKCSILGILGTVDDQAQVLEFIVNARNMTGQLISVNGGMAF